MNEIGLKALPRLMRGKWKEQKDKEKRRFYRVRLALLKGTLVIDE